nr:uncharacterized protein LOC110360169 isoform X4 [Columba livia]
MPFCAQAAAREEESQHQLFPGFALCLSSLPALPGRRRGLPGSLWLHSFHLLASKYELQINIIGLALQKNGVMSGDAALSWSMGTGRDWAYCPNPRKKSAIIPDMEPLPLLYSHYCFSSPILP